jgi:carbonic anhydrase
MAAKWNTASGGVLAGLLIGLMLAGGNASAWERTLDAEPGTPAAWSYAGSSGPEGWADLSPTFSACGIGRLQSPVSIDTPATVTAPCQPLRFRYRSSSLYITNDGHALRLGYDRGSYLVVDGLSYELVELRFHVPAEHAIDGRVADGELQLIHGNNRGDIAVVAVPLRAGRRVNQILRRVVENAPSVPGEQFYGRNVGVNGVFLLPGRKDYYAYPGSLTRPPCTEGVRWYVLHEALEVDASDLLRLARLIGPNARPIQPLHDRPVAKVCEP